MGYLIAAGVLVYSTVLFMLFGWSEGFYWHYMTKSKDKLKQRYEHELWTAMRIFFHLPVGWFLVNSFGWFSLLGVAGLVGMSFFTHDGAYYTSRDILDGAYPKRWWAHSSTSTAKMTFGPFHRTGLFVWGLILYCMMFLSI